MEKMTDDVFTIPARRCKLCGRLLTSDKAIQDGYGPVCRSKACQEAAEREMDKDQLSFWGGNDGTTDN